jgi:hypothetical protein
MALGTRMGKSLTKGAMTRSRKLEMSSAGQPQAGTIGLPGLSGL